MDAITLALLKALGGGGGGSGLPPTGPASAGDVLSLDSNKDPQWAAPSGGGGVLVVGATFTETTMTLNKTWQEIHDADVAFVVVTDPWGNVGSKEAWLVSSVRDDGDGQGAVIVSNVPQQDFFECTVTSYSGYPVFQQS